MKLFDLAIIQKKSEWIGLSEIASYFGKSDDEIILLSKINDWPRKESVYGPVFLVSVEEVVRQMQDELQPYWRRSNFICD